MGLNEANFVIVIYLKLTQHLYYIVTLEVVSLRLLLFLAFIKQKGNTLRQNAEDPKNAFLQRGILFSQSLVNV